MLFEEWPKSDPEGVIAALSGTNNVGIERDWRTRVVNTILVKDVERGIRLLSEWNIENYGPRMTAVEKWAAQNPLHAAEFALAYPSGFASKLIMETIGKEWAKTDPARALDFARTQRGELASQLVNAALKDWAGRDLNAAADWLSTADAATRNRLSSPFVEAWAKKDATAALTWCEANLSGSSLVQAVGGVFKGAAAKDPASAAGLVTPMSPSPARAEAALAVARKLFPDFSSEKPVPRETIAWLTTLDSDSTRRVLDQLQWHWSSIDPASMAAFLATADPDSIPSLAYTRLARSMARKNPAAALDWANQIPEDRRMTAATEAFSEWQQAQPDMARKWLSELPPNDSRREPLFERAISFLAHDPHGEEQFATMNANERVAARKVVEKIPLPEERRARLLEALARK